METPKDWQKEVFEKYPSLHKAITGAKINIFGAKNAQNDLVKLLNIKSQLKADKEELLEILNETFLHITPLTRFLKEPYQTGLKSRAKNIESLIQKHKQ